MTQPAGRYLAHHRPALELIGSELLRHALQLGHRHFTAIDNPLAHLRQRNAHEPTAALARAPRQRDHRAECDQVAGAIIDRGHRIELWTWLITGNRLGL